MFNNRTSLSPGGRAVVVTGASSGLGRETALRLAALGFRVFAGVRDPDDGEELVADCPSPRMTPVLIDVTNEDSLDAAAAHLSGETGKSGLWALVNNAGICISAPLECLSSEQLRRQLDTNVVGQLAATRAFLPLLRAAHGRVVNVTSGLGIVAIPYLGAYSIAQFAKEAMSDALRRELRPFGVTVSVVRPGSIMTPIWAKISRDGLAILGSAPDHIAQLYRKPFVAFLEANEYGARMSKTQPSDVANAVELAVTSITPKTRYRVGSDVVRGSLLARVLPDTVLDSMFSKIVAAEGDPVEDHTMTVTKANQEVPRVGH